MKHDTWPSSRSRVLAGLGLLVGTLAALDAASAVAAEEDGPKDMIADQIRDQGYACENPQEATRDPEYSKPDEAAWILTCEDTTYRVILVPDMGARVERLN